MLNNSMRASVHCWGYGTPGNGKGLYIVSTVGLAGSSGCVTCPGISRLRRRLTHQPKPSNQRAEAMPSFSRNFQFRTATLTVIIGAWWNVPIAARYSSGMSRQMCRLTCCCPAQTTDFAVTRYSLPPLLYVTVAPPGDERSTFAIAITVLD